ncbi:MAG: SRPBCC family protein [Candidatus Dormibacteria bacterium]
MGTRIRVATIVEASPEATWAVIENIETHVAWMADAASIIFKTSQRSGEGTVFDCVTRVGPIRLVDRMSITRWVPGAAMGVDHRGAVRGSGVFTLRAIGTRRTLFSWEEALKFPWWLGGSVGEIIARPLLTRIWRGNMVRLKRIVELH